MTPPGGNWKYLVIWEFHVQQGLEGQFERVYGSEGDWAALFGPNPEYCGTELVRDKGDARRYLTLDYWTSEGAYEAFRKAHASEYKQIDEGCERLTVKEREIGRFSRAFATESS